MAGPLSFGASTRLQARVPYIGRNAGKSGLSKMPSHQVPKLRSVTDRMGTVIFISVGSPTYPIKGC